MGYDYSEDVVLAHAQLRVYYEAMIQGRYAQAHEAARILEDCAHRLYEYDQQDPRPA